MGSKNLSIIKTTLLSSIFFFSCSVGLVYSSESVVVESEGQSCISYDKSRKQTEEDALNTARKNASRAVKTYVEVEMRVKDLSLVKDEVSAFSTASVKVIDTIESSWFRDPEFGECYKVKIKAEVTPDARSEIATGSEKEQNKKALEERGLEYSADSFVEAAKEGRQDIVNLFIKAGIDLNGRHSDKRKMAGSTAIIWASILGDVEMARILIAAGADVNIVNSGRATAMWLAATNGHYEVLQMLINGGADLKKFGGGLLNMVAQRGQLELVSLLLEKGVAAASARGNKALITAADSGSTEIAALLIEKGADLEAQDSTQRTPLMHAAETGRTETITMLIDKGAKINASDKYGDTALMRAIQRGHDQAAITLIQKGADLNMQSNKGQTALILAVRNREGDVAKNLISAGANRNIADKKGKTALTYAKEKKNKEILALLEK